MIKIDVVGNKHLILNGGNKLLRNDALLSILVGAHSEFTHLKETLEAKLRHDNWKYYQVQSSRENEIWTSLYLSWCYNNFDSFGGRSKIDH